MTFCDTAGSRVSRRCWQCSHQLPCTPMGHRSLLCDQEAPGSIALLHACAARDDTSVPTVSARASTAGRVVIHPTPDAIRHVQPLHRTGQGTDPAKRQLLRPQDSNRSRDICQLRLAGTTQWSTMAGAISAGLVFATVEYVAVPVDRDDGRCRAVAAPEQTVPGQHHRSPNPGLHRSRRPRCPRRTSEPALRTQ